MTDAALAAARGIIEKYGTRDPVRAAKLMDIDVIDRNFTEQKGAFCLIEGVPFIFVSGKLNESERAAVCAHELGHALLHMSEAKNGALCEYDLFNMATSIEYEANVFASELLIDGAEMDEYLRNGADLYSAAGALGVSVNLLLIKLAELNRRGRGYRLPFVPAKDFLASEG